MIWNKRIVGKYVELQYARIEDAEFILKIRQDPELTKYLPRLDISVEQQKNWLKEQQLRDGDYYFVVWRKDGKPIGTIRVYNIREKQGETGSIAIKGTATETMEAKLLCDDFAYETLGLKDLSNIVRTENIAIIRFVERFGVQWNEPYVDENGKKWMTGYNSYERSEKYRNEIRKALYDSSDEFTINEEIVQKNEDRIFKILSKKITSIDFKINNELIDQRIIDSLGLVSVVKLLENEFNLNIPYTYVNARNFNSIRRMAILISNLNRNTKKEIKNIEEIVLEPLAYNESETEKSVVQRLMENALKNPNDCAIIAQDKETTYLQLANMILSISKWLEKLGIEEGDCVAVQALHEDICIATYYAIHLLGAKLVAVEKNIAQSRIEEIADATDCKIVIECNKEKKINCFSYDEVRAISNEYQFNEMSKIQYPALDLPCEIIFTTGTTGKSKGVVITHRNISWYSYAVAVSIGMKKKNRFLLTTPLNHAGGLRRTHLSLANGCCMVYIDGLSDLDKYFNYIQKYKVTSLYLPPVAIRILLTRTGDSLSKYYKQIDFVYSSSSSLPMGDCLKLKELLPKSRLYNAYEASETPGVSVYNYNSEKVYNNCIGKANEGVELGILLENGEITSEANIQGQICVKSKMNMLEYYKEKELTNSVKKEGWFISSDLGYLDKNGELFYSGRKGDVINIGGYKIAPTEVEENALLSDMIDECICIEEEDEFKIPYLKLLVVKKSNKLFDAIKLSEFLANRLESYKIPRKIECIDEVKKTFNGKIDRKFYR